MKSEKFSIASVAKVVEGKLGRPVQLMKDPVRSKVEVACDEPAPGTVILLESSRLYIEEEGKEKMLEATRPGQILRRSRNSKLPLPRWSTSTQRYFDMHVGELADHRSKN